MARSVTIEGTQYFWSEYLLYEPQIGFRWLVHSDDHWNYVRAVPPGDVYDAAKSAVYDNKSYRIFQDAQARVEVVLGEFYWKVETGEQVRGVDYVKPPYMLSKEVSTVYITDPNDANKTRRSTGEINWSQGTYMPVPDVEKAFSVSGLPRPSNIAPNQPYKHWWVYKYWLGFILLLALTGFLSMVFAGSTSQVFSQTVTFQPLPNEDGTQVFFSEPFELKGRRNIRVLAQSPVQNTWVALEGDLINDETGVVQSFPIEISYYQGVEDGESWSEGGQSDSAYTSSMPGGQIHTAVGGTVGEVVAAGGRVCASRAERDARVQFPDWVDRVVYWTGDHADLSHRFERRRWSESMFSGGDDSDDDDD